MTMTVPPVGPHTTRDEDLIGTGWRFHVGVDALGGIALSSGTDDIEQAIELIIGTPVGARIMRPEFGCRIHELIFAPLNAGTLALAEYYVRDALGMWEPRITVVEVIAEASDQSTHAGVMSIYIEYEIRTTYDRRALIYPFYTIPDEE